MKLFMSEPTFEYDVRGLLMAFYPGESIVTGEEETEKTLEVIYGGASEPCRIRLVKKDGQVIEESVVFPEERPQAKTALKRALYRILQKDTGKELPWGTLTGIRPTKIAMGLLHEGKTDEEIISHLKDELYVSDQKSSLAIEIAKREDRLLKPFLGDHGYSLYVDIPFCPTTCAYCSFTSFPLQKFKDRVKPYLDTLKTELRYVAEAFQDRPLHTIYFGGGTPTTLEPEEMDGLLREIRSLFDISGVKEWTVEAGRPDSITAEKLAVLRDHPVSRISINPQTMHQKTLDIIGRKHTVQDIVDIFHTARLMGFDNINMDLILGLPGEDASDVEETMKAVTALDPDNVTLHSLAIKRAARLNTDKDTYMGYKMINTEGIMDMCAAYLRAQGENPYYLYRQKNMAGNLENVGYAKPGKEGLYNILIMEETETILACGAGASTKRVEGSWIDRAENVKNVDIYIRDIDEMIARKQRLFSKTI